MEDIIEKIIICGGIFLSAILICAAAFMAEEKTDPYGGIIRFHVVANSNSSEDQRLKLKVRDDVLEYVNRDIARYCSAHRKISDISTEEIRAYLKKHDSEIVDRAGKTLREQGFSYRVSSELGVRLIPEKYYGDIKFPAGNYEAYTLYIGAAEGQNWWCVMFPPLCLIDSEGREKEKGFYLDGDSERIILRSRILEMIKERTAR